MKKTLFNKKTCYFDVSFESKDDVLRFIASELEAKKFVSSGTTFYETLLDREALDSTGIGDGLAIPHGVSKAVKKPVIAFIKLARPIDWNSIDEKPVDLIFVIASKEGTHLEALSSLSQQLMSPGVMDALHNVKNYDEFIRLFETKKEKVVEPDNKIYDIVGITACPTGIAHTYIAAEKLVEYATNNGLTAKIETQGRKGVDNKLTPENIKNAKMIILAHDKALMGLDRFNDLEVIDTSTQDAIFNGNKLISEYAEQPKTVIHAKKDESEVDEFSLKNFKNVKENLLAGVSKMLPFIVAGGIILGIAFLIDAIAGNSGPDVGFTNPAAKWFFAIGKTTIQLMVPVLAAYIAYSLVGIQGLMPGFVAGMLADNTGGFVGQFWKPLFKNNIPMQSGFVGGLAGAYLAGIIVFGLTLGFSKFKKPYQGVRDIVLIPLLSVLGVGLGMFIINIPLGYLMWGIQKGLTAAAQVKWALIPISGLIGLMMCIDMGGPINKIAYITATALLAEGSAGSQVIMAASMGAGMVPPLAIALSTVMYKKVWTKKERDEAQSNWLMGAFFITEGAIPFMIKDPKKVMISGMIGGLTTGLLSGALQINLAAPHGGIAVFPLVRTTLFGTNTGLNIGLGIVFYILVIMAGALVMAVVLGEWKKADAKKIKAEKKEAKKKASKAKKVAKNNTLGEMN